MRRAFVTRRRSSGPWPKSRSRRPTSARRRVQPGCVKRSGTMNANPQMKLPHARPPFRADHVGSFLRPGYLLLAREAAQRGELTAAQLREVEDRAIREVVKLQQ